MIARAVWEQPMRLAVTVFVVAALAAWVGGRLLHDCYREVFG